MASQYFRWATSLPGLVDQFHMQLRITLYKCDPGSAAIASGWLNQHQLPEIPSLITRPTST